MDMVECECEYLESVLVTTDKQNFDFINELHNEFMNTDNLLLKLMTFNVGREAFNLHEKHQ